MSFYKRSRILNCGLKSFVSGEKAEPTKQELHLNSLDTFSRASELANFFDSV